MINNELYLRDGLYHQFVDCLTNAITSLEQTPRELRNNRISELMANNTIESLCEFRNQLAVEKYRQLIESVIPLPEHQWGAPNTLIGYVLPIPLDPLLFTTTA